MAEDQNLPADEQENNTKQRKRPGKTVNHPWHCRGGDGYRGAGLVVLTRNEETTDDAFTDGDVVTIAPKTAGYVTELRVRDNQRVKRVTCWWLSIRVIPLPSAIRRRPSLGWR